MYTYKPTTRLFNTPFILRIPTIRKIKGVEVKEFIETDVIYCSYVTFGGTERDFNGLILQTKTGQISTWFRPDIKADCQLRLAGTDRIFEIITEPENIEMRNQYMQFRVQVREGGA